MNTVAQWHPIAKDGLPTDFQDVWFVVDGNVFVGFYWEEGELFGLADGRGFKAERVSHWMATDLYREVAGYPKYMQRVAVELMNQPCLLTATFNNHYVDKESGDECVVAELDPIYAFSDSSITFAAAKWSKVFAWIPVPEAPLITQINSAFREETPSEETVVVVEVPEETLPEEAENPEVSDFRTPMEGMPDVEGTPEQATESPEEKPSSAIKASRVQEALDNANLGGIRRSIVSAYLNTAAEAVEGLKKEFPRVAAAYGNSTQNLPEDEAAIVSRSTKIEAIFDEICDNFINNIIKLQKTIV